MRVMLVAAESLNSHILNFLSLFVGVGEKGINIKKKKTPKETSGESKLVFGF